jgi:hypothetical protein
LRVECQRAWRMDFDSGEEKPGVRKTHRESPITAKTWSGRGCSPPGVAAPKAVICCRRP